ncbi:MAG: MerR family DNA-binding protein [Burkholderiales bacterium]|jgi:MerR family mercuric resistance operon transcriptional regulator|nr:MerR family DNA-binding protein [Burkholderiales bacterium]
MDGEPLQLTIGALAEGAAVTVEAVRFYQRRKLLPEPRKPLGGIRRYDGAVLARLRFIKAAQRLGFCLEDVGELLELDDGSSCRQVREKAERKLGEVRGKLAELSRIEGVLADLVARCRVERGRMRCPVIAELHEVK